LVDYGIRYPDCRRLSHRRSFARRPSYCGALPRGIYRKREQLIQSTVAEGIYLAIVSIATALICGGLICLFVKLRKGIKISGYLAFKPLPSAALLKWLGVVMLLWALSDLTGLALKRDIVPPFMIKAYSTAGNLAVFWLGIALAAPVFEELFFRGFIFAGWSASRLGPVSTIFLTAALWASIHQQYDLYDIAVIGATGVALGAARLKTGSLYMPILMHCLQNVIATTEVWIVARTAG
jgi:hypothetical protein